MYDRHHGFVWRVLRRLGVPAAALDDATQEVFVVVHRRWGDLDPDAAERSWLYGIARRVAADMHRKQRRARRKLDALPQPEAPQPLEQTLERAEAADVVRSFLQSLDEGHRMVFVLCDVEGMTAPEVSDTLGIKVNTVYSRLRNSRRRFEKVVARRQAMQREVRRHG